MTNATQSTLNWDDIVPNKMSLICVANPEWGAWRICEKHEDHLTIWNRGFRILWRSEAEQMWAVNKR